MCKYSMNVCMYVCKAVSFDFIQDALLGPGEGKGSCLSSGSPELSKGMTKSSMFGRTSFFCGRREEDGGVESRPKYVRTYTLS